MRLRRPKKFGDIKKAGRFRSSEDVDVELRWAVPTNVGVRREEGIKLFQHRLARLYHHFDWPTAVQPSRDMGTIQKNNSQIYPSIGGLDQREPARMHRSIRLLVQRKNVSIVTLSKHHHHVIMMT